MISSGPPHHARCPSRSRSPGKGTGAPIFPKTEDDQDDQLAIPHVADAPRELTEEEREARQLDLDRLYVGMTRARERLYLIADASPCPEIERARNLMD